MWLLGVSMRTRDSITKLSVGEAAHPPLAEPMSDFRSPELSVKTAAVFLRFPFINHPRGLQPPSHHKICLRTMPDIAELLTDPRR